MYLSESLFKNYELTEPELVELKYFSYYNCGYGILKWTFGVSFKKLQKNLV